MEHSGELAAFTALMNRIDDKLYLGGLMGAGSREAFERNQIKSVVSALSVFSYMEKFPQVEYYSIQIDDACDADMACHLQGAIQFILNAHAQEKNVFVHCAAGISRSTTVACAFMMTKHQIRFEEALGRIRESRQCAAPNSGFQRQLKAMDVQGMRKAVGLT